MYGDNDSSMLDYGGAQNPVVVGGDPSLHLSSMKKKNKWQSFLGGMQGSGGIGGGLSSMAGSGGVSGAVGNIAKFLI
jgi:hypothetical protein